MNQVAAKVCADCGLLVIVTPASMDLLCKALKAMPKHSVVDAVLGERTGCLVVGSKDDSAHARKRLGIAPDSGRASFDCTLSFRSVVLPGTDVEVCRLCGGWKAWCTQDAPRETVEAFHERVAERRSQVKHFEFGTQLTMERCSCVETSA